MTSQLEILENALECINKNKNLDMLIYINLKKKLLNQTGLLSLNQIFLFVMSMKKVS